LRLPESASLDYNSFVAEIFEANSIRGEALQELRAKLPIFLESGAMSAIDDVLVANQEFARNFSAEHLPLKPAKKLAVIACMDYRIPNAEALGLKNGDAVVIRNAGGVVTEDALRSLIVAHYLLEVQEIIIINHTQCGMMKIKDQEYIEKLEKETGISAVIPANFYAFDDLTDNVRRQYRRLKSHPWIPDKLLIRGFVYDVHSGRLTEVPLS
jgi:carbonic anhydrase